MKRLILLVSIGIVAVCMANNSMFTKEQSTALEYRFQKKHFNKTITYIRDALDGYKCLTNIVQENSNLERDYHIHTIHQYNIPEDAKLQAAITGKQLRQCKNIGWEFQYLGFPNCLRSLHGHYDFLEYQILKLQLEFCRLSNIFILFVFAT